MNKILGILSLLTVIGCTDIKLNSTPDEEDAGVVSKTVEEVSGDITGSRVLYNTKDYLLKGLVSVKAGTILTIEKGTKVMGDSVSKAILLVEPGAKLVAQGTANEPIVFTSQAAVGVRRAGDWGGLVLLGNAPVNIPGGKGNVEGLLKTIKGTEFGGTDPNDSSGILRYVRIEYAGVVLSQDNEVNGITFAGVGRGTVVDHIQVREALDDCFEFFGGTVDAKYLVCQKNEDDGFDFDNGYQGRLQFLVLQQDPTHPGEDNGFESDNDAQGSGNVPLTMPQVYNTTLCGKNREVDSSQFGFLLRKNSRGQYGNILVNGFESGLDMRDAVGKAASQNESGLSVRSSLFLKSTGVGVIDNMGYQETGSSSPNKDNDDGLDEVLWLKSQNNSFVSNVNLDSCFDLDNPNFKPSSVIVGENPPNDGFFDSSANYVGAFKDSSDNWDQGSWLVWKE